MDIQEILEQYMPILKDFGLAVLIFIFGWVVSKWAQKFVLKTTKLRKFDEALGRFMASMAKYTIIAATLIASLGAVGIQTTSLVAIFASAGLAVGLALQGSLSNFASGVMILFFRPVELGDKVTIAGHTGVVEDIGIFTTTMITGDNHKIIIPNQKVTGDSIVNYTAKGIIRGCVTTGVAYGSDVAQVMDLLATAAKKAALVLQDPAPVVIFDSLGASSIDFNVFTWCESHNYRDMLHQVRTLIYEDLNAAGIEIPFNQLVVHGVPAAPQPL